MKTTRLFLFVVCLGLINPLFAQKDYAFKVLVNKGQNEIKSGNNWLPLKTGATLKSGDEVKIVTNAYLGLIHNSGKPLELKEAKIYKVKDLEQQLGSGSSVVNKYTEFMLSSNTEKKNRMTATGAVHRGGHSTRVFLPKSEMAIVYSDVVILDWERKPEEGPYVVNLKSVFGDDLMTTEATTNTLTINLMDDKFAAEDNIIVEVYPKSNPTKRPDPPFIIKRMSEADKARIKGQLKEIEAETSQNNAMSKMILASFFEQHKLLIDAGNAYQEAIQLAPDVEQFKEDYHSFLVRNAIVEEKK